MDNFTPANIAVGFVVTWGIGLMPPLLIRYAFLKRPMGKWPAIWVCGGFWFFSFLLYSAVSGSAKGHNALILVAMVSYWILRKDSTYSTSQQNADAQLNVPSPSPNTLKPSHATPNVSIYIPPQQPLPIQQVAMIPESTMHAVSIGEPTLDEDAIYEVVANEMDSGKMDKGLWTRLYAEHDGDEKKTKIAYIKQRAEKLMTIERHNYEHQVQEQAERARLAEEERIRQMPMREKIRNNLIDAKEAAQRAGGMTPQFLHLCEQGELKKVADLLGSHPVLVAVAAADGYTGLHIAVLSKNEPLVALLLEHGANPDVKDQHGRTPYDLAQMKAAENVMDYPAYKRVADLIANAIRL